MLVVRCRPLVADAPALADVCPSRVAPLQYENVNFKLADIGRATSAAPAFLPRECLV